MPKLGLDWAELQSCWEKVRDSGYFTEGYFVRAFEDEVSKWSNLSAVAVNSAGSGLYAMLRMAKINAGPIAVQNNTFYATGAMAREIGREIHLVDCNTSDFSMSYHDLVDRAPADLAAVILTHVGGGLAKDYYDIARWTKMRGIPLFEDAAHVMGVGGDSTGPTAGLWGDAAVFSFYPTKAFPAGDAGVIVTPLEVYAERLREFRNYGKYFENGVVRYRRSGFNFRLDEWTAAICYLQMKRRKEIMQRRHDAAGELRQVALPMLDYFHGETNWYKYIVHKDVVEQLGVTRKAGQVFAATDQLVTALQISDPGPMHNSRWIADNHACLPIDEGLYEGKNKDQIIRWLRGED
jgi:perosamine synthetase